MRRCYLVLSLLACCIPAAVLAGGVRYQFTDHGAPLNATLGPNITGSSADDVNNTGSIVGYFTDASNVFHGFLLSGGIFTQIDVPGATKTLDRGREGPLAWASPPSEPDWRVSRIRLSSRWSYLKEDWRDKQGRRPSPTTSACRPRG